MKDYVEVIINGDDYLLSVDELYNIIHEYEIYRDLELEDVFTSDEDLPPTHVCDRAIGMNYVG
jgi:hypothetical protein